MPKINQKIKQATLLVSILAAVVLSVFGYLFFGVGALDNFIFFSVVLAITPYAILDYVDYNWRKNVDAQLPELFRSIVQAQETGMTLPQALEEAAKRNYGPLTGELRKMTVQMSWGASFEEALQAFGKRVGTVLALRTVPMIIEAGRSGGHVEKVFEPMGSFIQTTLLLEKERKAQTRPYIAIIYVALFVFLFTIAILFKTFFTGVDGLSLFNAGASSAVELKAIFLHLSLVQGFFGGLVAGKMGEGTIGSGLKHSVLMMLMAYLTITFFL
ncbi:MAG: type II secretion system F family protein [Candidatus Bathyarchaeia archaeon]|jgi:flagellar protein FlaJ